jgi:hypothetical protein
LAVVVRQYGEFAVDANLQAGFAAIAATSSPLASALTREVAYLCSARPNRVVARIIRA